MEITIQQAAELIGGNVVGDERQIIKNVARINEARNGDLTFLYLPAYEKFFSDTKATAILVKPDFPKTREDIIYIETDEPHTALREIIVEFFSYQSKLNGIDTSARIHESVRMGKNVAIGKNVVIGENCTVGEGTVIYHNTVIMHDSAIGNNCLVYPNVSIREASKIGNNVIIHPGAVIGSDGFGYTHSEEGIYSKIPQIGNVVIEDDVEIGANVTIDRAAIGSTIIKKGVKLDNLVQIAHNVTVGENTVLSAQSGIAGSTSVGDRCILAGQVGIAGHLTITDDVIIAAQSGVSKSLTKPGKYFGYPAKEMTTTLRLESHIRNLPNYSERIKTLEKKIAELESIIQKSKEENT